MKNSKNRVKTEKIWRVRDICQTLKINRSTLYLWISKGLFPPGFKLGPNIRAWTDEEFQEWIRDRINMKIRTDIEG